MKIKCMKNKLYLTLQRNNKIVKQIAQNQRKKQNLVMGSILSQEESVQVSQRSQGSMIKINKNWRVLQKSLEKQILQSNKTELIVERYWFQIQHHQDFESENTLYNWRNNNPNSQFMVNVLSVGKDQFVTQNQTVQCAAINWCPSERIVNKVYVVTERILKIEQFTNFLIAKNQLQLQSPKNKPNVLYASEQKKNPIINEKLQKFKPFLQMNLTVNLLVQLIRDWLRGIQVLCYKFGYFKISPQLLGVTIHKRGTVWINKNYALNHVNEKQKIQISTAEQKFKYEKDTVQKILKFIQKVDQWKDVIETLKSCERFEQTLKALKKIQVKNIKVQKEYNSKPNNSSLFVQQGSFLNPNNISVLRFDHGNLLQRLNSDKKLVSQQRLSLVNSSKLNGKNLVNSQSNRSMTKKSMKRSNTGDKIIIKNISSQNKQETQMFINSGHKYGGRQTAPTNQLGHSSSLQSVNHLSQRGNIEQGHFLKQRQEALLVKSQRDQILINETDQRKDFRQQLHISPNHKVYYPNHIQRNYFSAQPHMFRSQNNISLDLYNKGSNKQENKIHNQKHSPKQNFSLDEINMIGPYRTDRIYSNLKKQKIALVDSMVMVRQQSQQIDQQFHNGEKTKIIMEESIIIRGKQDQNLLSELYE